MGLFDAFKQYVRDAIPGGLLNAEIEQGANDTANAIRAKGKAFERGLFDPQQYAGEALRAGMDMVGMAPLGLTVWHGSPHKFSKFDMSKIGTGEGAQVYGHGLYMAETPDVARQYAQTLDPMAQTARSSIDAEGTAARVLQAVDYNKQKAIDELTRRKNMTHVQGDAEWAAKMDAAIAYIKGVDKTSQLYKVDIPDEAVARFLDWDKPLSQQAPEVQKALFPIVEQGRYASKSLHGDPMGHEIYSFLDQHQMGARFIPNLAKEASRLGVNPNMLGSLDRQKYISEYLNSQGVRGIRYLDGGSRSAGQGSSNFVLFDDQLPRILEINGVPTGLSPWKPGEFADPFKEPFSGNFPEF